MVEEKAGSARRDSMTAAAANRLRSARIEGKSLSNEERRQEARAHNERWTISRLFQEYQATHPTKSAVVDRSNFRYLEKPFGDLEPQEIQPLAIDRLRVGLLKEKSPQTVKHVLALLLRLCRWGADKELCAPYAHKITMPRVNNKKIESLTDAQLARLLEVLETFHDRPVADMLRLMLFSGMRRGECFSLQWQDVDFAHGLIRIAAPKSGTPKAIPMNTKAREILSAHPRDGASEYVFPGRDGERRVDIRRPLAEIRKLADLPKSFRPCHGLRHLFASKLVSAGASRPGARARRVSRRPSSLPFRPMVASSSESPPDRVLHPLIHQESCHRRRVRSCHVGRGWRVGRGGNMPGRVHWPET